MSDTFLGDGLRLEESLPLAFTPGLPDTAQLARLNADNHQLLIANSTLDEARLHEALKDESQALVQELQRLDYKLNLLLRLTTELAVRQRALPPLHRVRLAANGMDWVGDDAPPRGASGILSLYVSQGLPQPLQLPAVVVGELPHNNLRTSQLKFTGLSEQVVELIEKLIFRHHRRRVAGSRLAIPPHP